MEAEQQHAVMSPEQAHRVRHTLDQYKLARELLAQWDQETTKLILA